MIDRGQDGHKTPRDVPSRHFRFEGEPSLSRRLTPEHKTDEELFLLKLGFSKPFVAAMKARCLRNATTIEAELLASGQVREEAYYGALAKVLGSASSLRSMQTMWRIMPRSTASCHARPFSASIP
jgi:hypothetical protein